jgi:hypothetical protein
MVNGNINMIKKAALTLGGVVVGVIGIGITALVTLSQSNNEKNLDGISEETERKNTRRIDYDRFNRR